LAYLRAKKRADERTRTADLLITRELFLLDEKRALHLLSFRPVYWTATNVKVGTICVRVLSNARIYRSPNHHRLRPRVGAVRHVLLLFCLGITGQEDVGRAVGKEDGHRKTEQSYPYQRYRDYRRARAKARRMRTILWQLSASLGCGNRLPFGTSTPRNSHNGSSLLSPRTPRVSRAERAPSRRTDVAFKAGTSFLRRQAGCPHPAGRRRRLTGCPTRSICVG
jgi:hypothetical protein